MASSVVGNNTFLKVNPADLTAKATQVQSTITTMEDLMNQMTTTFNTLSENWQSTSGDAYKEKALMLISEVKESLDNLTFYVNDLNDAAAKYEDLESEINAKVSGLEDASNIFNV